ncbi:MAG: methylmalonyl-CoA mutase family protein, partial [Myxococcota bacterium]
MNAPARYELANPVRIVTAASLFDGHDAAINIMRRILQSSGAEVIHLGHNRSVAEIVDCAIQEDAQAIALTSYQGGHVEYLKYMFDMLKERGADIRLFAGGGGTILPTEIEELHAYGIDRIYSPDDGRELGLQGMIDDLLQRSDFAARDPGELDGLIASLSSDRPDVIAGLVTLAENHPELRARIHAACETDRVVPVLGITGTGGAGKSSLVDELVRRFLRDQPGKKLAILSIDPSKRKTGGALLGDRIRMNSVHDPRIYMRSLATRQAHLAMSGVVPEAVQICKKAGFDFILVETSGIGQSDTAITEVADSTLYVMTSEYGAATQLEKIDMLDFADLIAINKFDKRGSLDALRDVRKQVKRNTQRFMDADETLPVYGTIASQFNDPGTNRLYLAVMQLVADRFDAALAPKSALVTGDSEKVYVIPPDRSRYLAEIAETSERVDADIAKAVDTARRLYRLAGAIAELRQDSQTVQGCPAVPAGPIEPDESDSDGTIDLVRRYNLLRDTLHHEARDRLARWPEVQALYGSEVFAYQVRGRTIEQPLWRETLSQNKVPRVALPTYEDWGDVLAWLSRENVPGEWPYTAGVFPLKRSGEDPARMFAGEGGPERTNKRFHYVSRGLPAKRLSTAFDSVTLYGEDPDWRPDIYGKVGNSGVSVANVDDAKKLYSGFDLCDPKTSVSMTINGPAPMLLAFFLNAAIDQGCEKHIRSQGREAEVTAAIGKLYADRGVPRPAYQGALPEGNDGLGLLLLGASGDEVLEAETYE